MTLSDGIRLTVTEAEIILSWASVDTRYDNVSKQLQADKVLFLKDGKALAYLGNDIYLFSSLQVDILFENRFLH